MASKRWLLVLDQLSIVAMSSIAGVCAPEMGKF